MQRTSNRFYWNQIRGCAISLWHTLFSFERTCQDAMFSPIPERHIYEKSIFQIERCSLVGIPGLEPGMTGPESVVLPLHHIPILLLRRMPEWWSWDTRTRTRNDRTRICSVTITPYPNIIATSNILLSQLRVQRYNIFLNHQNFSALFSKKSQFFLFSMAFSGI